MKKLLSFIIISVFSASALAQDFNKNIATAKTSYAAGNLEDARFAMQQMLNDLDMAIGREVLKMLPSKMGSASSNAANDNVTANTGLMGVATDRKGKLLLVDSVIVTGCDGRNGELSREV